MGYKLLYGTFIKTKNVVLQEQREREKQDLELAKEMADDDEDSFP